MQTTVRLQLIRACRAIGLTLALAGCLPAPVTTSVVSIQDDQFEPRAAQVAAGDTVTWNWEGNNNHVVVGDAFESDAQADGSFRHRFDQPGTYDYRCTLHAGMRGTVTVTD